jgi:cyclopropane-fatty-acyl-phospholipid synthase
MELRQSDVSSDPYTLVAAPPAAAQPQATPFEKQILMSVLRLFGAPAVRVELWDGAQIVPRGASVQVGFCIKDRATLWRFLRNPGYYLPEDYSLGRIDLLGEPVALLHELLSARVKVNATPSLQRFVLEHLGRSSRNTRHRSRDNIHKHYDLGNEFYRLWLDEELVYTCAYFADPAFSLEEAQRAKMDLVCRKLDLKPGERVLEVGCGWGGLARHMARNFGVTVRAYNISHEQVVEARRRAQMEGLDRQVEFIEDDYRAANGTYDAFVSVGMLEHVGIAHYRQLSDVIHRTLTPGGRGLLHSIAQNRNEALNSWIQRRIFPGAYPPSLRQMLTVLEPYSFTVLDVENLRLHYAKTLEHWLARFEGNVDRVSVMFDRDFVRTWRFYLTCSLAAFRSDSLQLFQVLFTRQGNNAPVSWTRLPWYLPR